MPNTFQMKCVECGSDEVFSTVVDGRRRDECNGCGKRVWGQEGVFPIRARAVHTMGAAVDLAIATHMARHPESDVYGAFVDGWGNAPGWWEVELRATHFSEPVVYRVPAEG